MAADALARARRKRLRPEVRTTGPTDQSGWSLPEVGLPAANHAYRCRLSMISFPAPIANSDNASHQRHRTRKQLHCRSQLAGLSTSPLECRNVSAAGAASGKLSSPQTMAERMVGCWALSLQWTANLDAFGDGDFSSLNRPVISRIGREQTFLRLVSVSADQRCCRDRSGTLRFIRRCRRLVSFGPLGVQFVFKHPITHSRYGRNLSRC